MGASDSRHGSVPGSVLRHGLRYDHEAHKWVPQCPYGDVCTGCDAAGECARAPRDSAFPSPNAPRAKANAIRVEAFSFPQPPASYFVEAVRLERQADAIERAVSE